MVHLLSEEVDRLLREDAPAGDLTTEALGLKGRRGRIAFTARGAFTLAGVEIAGTMLRRSGVAVVLAGRSGNAVEAGDEILSGEGDAAGLHLSWKTSQTLIEVLSGMATTARAIVDAVEAVDPNVRVACTRKTFPGGRALSQAAIKAGGAILHRAGLSDTVLVFAEHRAFMAGESLADIAARLRRRAPEKKLALDVVSLFVAKSAVEAGFDVIQLEKFPIEAIAEVTAFARARPWRVVIAAAGGVNAANAADYVRAGAGLIVTSAPYSAPPRDVRVTIALAI